MLLGPAVVGGWAFYEQGPTLLGMAKGIMVDLNNFF